ncbi:MAG: cobalamin biosynthesis protein, partial [Corynebacteriales bacterium]|nr:cobalamin biosynthesis protein [Mycobacteriales bacterium]
MINPPSARRVARALGLVAGLGVDLVFADPRRGHPVAGMGTLAGRLERVVYRDNRWAGVVFVGGCLVSVLTIAWSHAAPAQQCVPGQCLPQTQGPLTVTVPSTRYPTVQAGINAVASGGTVRVKAGVYVEAV